MKGFSLVLVLAVLACSNAFNIADDHKQHVANIMSRTQEMYDDHVRIFSLDPSGFAGACKTALEKMKNVTSCIDGAGDIMTGIKTNDKQTMDGRVGNFCKADGCGMKVKNAVTAVTQACYPDTTEAAKFNEVDKKMIGSLIGINDVICHKVNNEFCFGSMTGFQSINLETATEAQLASTCSPCSLSTITKLSTLVGNDKSVEGRYFELLCHKEGDKFCFKEASEIGSVQVDVETAAGVATYLGKLCSPCLKAFMSKYATIQQEKGTSATEELGIVELMGMMCSKSNTDTYCLVDFKARAETAWNLAGSACQADFESTAKEKTCSAGCKAAVGSLRASMGCCSSVPFKLMCINDMNKKKCYENFEQFNIACGFPIPKNCATKKLKAAIKINNLKYAYYLNNKPVVEEKLIKDFAFNFDKDPEQITVLVSKIGTMSSKPVLQADGVQADFEVELENDAEATKLTAVITQATTSGDLKMMQTGALLVTNPDAAVNPSQGLNIATTAPTVTQEVDPSGGGNLPSGGGSGSSASAVGPSLVVSLIAMLVAFLR
jgi:hypothetical protein